MSVKAALIPRERAEAFAEGLTEGDLEYLIRQVDARIRKDDRTPRRPRPGGHDVQQMKVDKGRDLRRRLVEALGHEPPHIEQRRSA
jgi:hypothetical protein